MGTRGHLGLVERHHLEGPSELDLAIFGTAVANDVAIRNYLEPIKQHLKEAGATEVWINQPGELLIECGPITKRVAEPMLTLQALMALATAVAVYVQQHIGPEKPILSATLPDGERIQIVVPPAVEAGHISITIRIPGSSILPLARYEESGAFNRFVWPHLLGERSQFEQLPARDRQLAMFLLDGHLADFLTAAVRQRRTIAVVGDTGSGKTTLMKSLCQMIPANERLVTIEDVRELELPNHHNRVHLLYSKGGQSVAKTTPSELIASCMRMKPDRVLPAELRGMEAWDFLKLLTTGHSGSITSYHAESCELAFERFMFMAKENMESDGLSREELKHLVRLTIDVILHIRAEPIYDAQGEPVAVDRYVDEVYFDPFAKMAARCGDKGAGMPGVSA